MPFKALHISRVRLPLAEARRNRHQPIPFRIGAWSPTPLKGKLKMVAFVAGLIGVRAGLPRSAKHDGYAVAEARRYSLHPEPQDTTVPVP